MANLPVIVSLGGINAAGRSSMFHGYRRLVIDRLTQNDARDTLCALATLMGLLRQVDGRWVNPADQPVSLDHYLASIKPQLLDGTLIRKLDNNLFDPQRLLYQRKVQLGSRAQTPVEFLINKKDMPDEIPSGWTVVAVDEGKHGKVHVHIHDNFEVLLQCYREMSVNSAGQLPRGFDPEVLYPARSHPRGLQLTVFGASDSVNSLGIDWETLRQHVAPDQISVYAGSGMGQLDYDGFGGMLKARLTGRKVTSKQLPLGYPEMPADFVNAYILGNLGTTGTNVAACATFLYNLRQGIRDIQSGTHRVAVIGTSEAPLVPEIFDGFATMGALADDLALRQLDKLSPGVQPDHRRACRPFGHNAGFTLAESAQFIILFDDNLAVEMGAEIYGAVNEVFVNADGYKKSITGPGLGNYITMAKAAAATRNIIGEQGLRERSYVQAHGTGTPQNRSTESHILSQVAGNFGISNWPVTALKAYVGHSLASAAGDQVTASLGVWRYGHLPGILTIRQVAEDVSTDNLDFLLEHREVGPAGMDAVLINSKGFGGNNATASLLAPHITLDMLSRKHGKAAMHAYQDKLQRVREKIADYEQDVIGGKVAPIYRYDHNVQDHTALRMDQQRLSIDGLETAISLELPNSYREFM
ncbi:MAG: hypothetical protein RLZZ385_921 [Pseudomonadota bacterium]|jgi:acetoacetyl-[acyl-carrier protein] synthase